MLVKDWSWILLWIVIPLVGLVIGFLYVQRVEVPLLKRRLDTIEKDIEYCESVILNAVQEEDCELHRNTVCKKLDDMKTHQKETESKILNQLETINSTLVVQEQRRVQSTTVHKMFITAVKEKMKLEFEIPVDY